jgi:plasmid stabilization system protein ParE
MELVWTEEAENTYKKITDDILSKWSINELISFMDKTDEIIDLITQHNEVGMVYKKTVYRQFLITKQVYLFYRLEYQKIYLITFWNNRQDPINLDSVLTT